MEIPACPDPAHAGSVRVRAGWYGRAGARRQRWWCTPADGSGRHRFAETLPRLACCDGATCPECATALEAWEGQPAPRLYGYPVRSVARALIRVAAGASFRSTAELIRTEAGRTRPVPPRQRGQKVSDPNRHGQLVSDWVEVFAPVIWTACTTEHAMAGWPARMILDEHGFRASATQANRRGTALFSVLGAVGYPRPGGRALVWRLEATAAANTGAWQGFLTVLPGRPQRVVTDGGQAITKAVTRVWPERPGAPAPMLRRCEWHLLRGLSDTLPESVRADPDHPLTRAMAGCLVSIDNWVAFEAVLAQTATRAGGLPATWAWVRRNREVILAQAATRDRLGPHSIGPLEDVFRHVDNVLDDRAFTMTNKARTDRLLMLLAADRNGWADERGWAEIIRDHLHHQVGVAEHQRQVTDPATSPSLR